MFERFSLRAANTHFGTDNRYIRNTLDGSCFTPESLTDNKIRSCHPLELTQIEIHAGLFNHLFKARNHSVDMGFIVTEKPNVFNERKARNMLVLHIKVPYVVKMVEVPVIKSSVLTTKISEVQTYTLLGPFVFKPLEDAGDDGGKNEATFRGALGETPC